MRKTISLVLVAAMLLTSLMFVPTASAATLDEYNVQIDAQYFGGTLIYNEISGTNQFGFEWLGEETIREGNAENGTLIIDGIIEEGEWTDKVYHIDSDYAPNSGNAYGNNALFETPSAENTFYRWIKDGNNKSLAPADGLEYDVRFMWDEDYFYIAVSHDDTDGYINSSTSDATQDMDTNWNGDAIQFRLDPAGPNAVVGGKGYDASVDSYPYDAELHGDEDNTPDCTYPWSCENTEYRGNYQKIRDTIGDFIFSYYTSGYTDMCDGSKRYYPEEQTTETEQDDGTIKVETHTVYRSSAIYDELAYDEPEKKTYACAYPHDINPHPAFTQDHVDYEIALPWAIVADDYAAVAGAELGFSMVRMNAQLGKGAFNSYLAWGSGITNYETTDMPQVCGGSNCLVLTDELAKDAVGCDHTFAEADCTTPEKCTACGYERGYVTGHKYAFSDQKLVTENEAGSIKAVCTVCSDTFVKTLDPQSAYTKYDFLENETNIADQGWRDSGGFCIQWEDLDENGSRYTDETDPTGELRVKWWNKDGTAKNALDKESFPGSSVLDLRDDGQTGTYFDGNDVEASYSEIMEVNFTKLPLTSEIDSDSAYNTYFGQWFGGVNGISHLAGLIEVEGQWFFAILPSTHQKPDSLETFYDVALSYTPATAEMISLNTWHEYIFVFDNDAETAMLIWDDQLVAAATDYHFPLGAGDRDSTPIFITHNAECFIKNIEVGTKTLAAARTTWRGEAGDVVVPVEKYTVTINGEAQEYEAGAVIDLEAAAFVNNGATYYRFDKWVGDVDGIADVTAATAKVTVEADMTIEATYFIIGDVNGDGNLNAVDSNTLKRANVGSVSLGADDLRRGDIDFDGSVKATDLNLLKRMNTGSYVPEK